MLFLLLLPYILYIIALTLVCSALWDYVNEAVPLFNVVITAPSAEKAERDYTPIKISPPETTESAPEEVTAPEKEAIAVTEPAETTAPLEAADETTAEAQTEKEASVDLSKPEKSPTSGKIYDRDMNDFPKIKYGQQWATLNVDGWERRDIPVYCGDTDEILSYGAGMSYYSRFCGQNGKTVISGHVMTDFYEIEDTEIGDYIVIDTIYAHFVYEVTEITVFNYKDPSLLMPDDGKTTLVMYTCYPRYDGLAFKEERIALVATMIEGVKYAW